MSRQDLVKWVCSSGRNGFYHWSVEQLLLNDMGVAGSNWVMWNQVSLNKILGYTIYMCYAATKVLIPSCNSSSSSSSSPSTLQRRPGVRCYPCPCTVHRSRRTQKTRFETRAPLRCASIWNRDLRLPWLKNRRRRRSLNRKSTKSPKRSNRKRAKPPPSKD